MGQRWMSGNKLAVSLGSDWPACLFIVVLVVLAAELAVGLVCCWPPKRATGNVFVFVVVAAAAFICDLPLRRSRQPQHTN